MASRKLTKGEITLAKTVFGDSIDYGDVRIHNGKFMFWHPKGTGMAPEGNLYMYGCYSDDYAKGGAEERAHFIHEMAHVWQFQNRILDPVETAIELNLRHPFNYLAAYDYKMDGKKDLLAYNMEQQATIIQDYFLLVRENHWRDSGRCKNREDEATRLAFYEKTLEKFLKNPSYAKRDRFPQNPLLSPKGPRK